LIQNKRKIINDPVYGFINIPSELTFDIIEHPWFQRLRRIKQLGLTHLVYPGALHTRFHHSLGAMHLMQETLNALRRKGNKINDEERQGAIIAILLHDIGHGPFSHALEHSLISNINHEIISRHMMDKLNQEFDGKLELGIKIFNNQYTKVFLSQLVSSQLDVDRLDYLTRDSFFTGVSEGVIGTQRIIKMLNVANGNLLVEAKGIYSIEKFIVARRIMYWQVYLHKAVLSAETMLIKILERAKYLSQSGEKLFATPALAFFLENEISIVDLEENPDVLKHFAKLDDVDILSAIKVWSNHSDIILSHLCNAIVNRKLFRCEIQPEPFDYFYIEQTQQRISETMKITQEDLKYFFISDTTSNYFYNYGADTINIMTNEGKILDLTEASDQFTNFTSSKPVTKHFICYPKLVNN